MEAGGGLTSTGVSNQVGPFLNFPPPIFFFLQIGLTVEINLTAKKLSKIAIRTNLLFVKERFTIFLLPA